MKTRAITAFFFTLVMLGSILLGVYTFSIFYLLLGLMALLEFYKMITVSGRKPTQWLGVLLGIAAFASVISAHILTVHWQNLLFITPLVLLVFLVELYKNQKEPFANIAYTLLGLIYVVVPFCFFYALGFLNHSGTYSYHLPLSFLLMLWANDTGAYLFGMKFGKRKLFERHSPKKSWEGFFGGVFTSVLVAVIISTQFSEFSMPVWIGMAIIISCFGTLGDLVESMLKRSLDVKDSGTFLPGHGGFLDRFDGLLIGAPLVYIYLYGLLMLL